MSKHEGPSAMVVFVRSSKETGDQRTKTGAEGPILWATGGFLQELEDGCGGWDISEHDIPEPDKGLHGLLLFEGWLDVSVGDDPDVNWEGWWRQLSSWELGRMRFGLPPHGEHTPIADDEAKAAEQTDCAAQDKAERRVYAAADRFERDVEAHMERVAATGR